MRARGADRRAMARRNLLILAAVVAALGIALGVYSYVERAQEVPQRGISTSGIGQRKKVEYQGSTYAQRTNITTVLLMGVDKDSEEETYYSARIGGQADFLLLLVLDNTAKTITPLQIDRDTITDVMVYGVLGNKVGTRKMQISLSHDFGRTPEICCRNTVQAVSDMLNGISIDYYMAVNMAAMSKVNSALGGVTVTLEQDLSALDPAMVQGATITLNDEQAYLFLRSRMTVGEGTNSERMSRHQQYMNAALDKITSSGEGAISMITAVFDTLDVDMTTNLSSGTVLAIASQAYNYQVNETFTLPGEHALGSDGFMEFHAADGAAQQWVMQTYYDLLN